VDDAHDHAGTAYDWYLAVHGRDSFDGNGAPILSSAHYAVGLENAMWDGTQLIYGDGGTLLRPLSGSLDLVAHELTHAVTDRTARLVYFGESGALNEATSDILAVAVGTWARGGAVDADTWKFGESIVRPALGRDAVRYLDQPTRDGISRDHYDNRFLGFEDNGGVHINSGIANKWFFLAATSGLGVDGAANVWFRALTLYMTPGTQFFQARTSTVQAATDLYGAGSTQVAAVASAWDAVGVRDLAGGWSWTF
jgi:thermolysin